MKKYHLYTTIRLKQAFRMLQSVGWIYVCLFVPILMIGILGLLERSLTGNYPMTALAFLFVVTSFHFQRKDHDFLDGLGASPMIYRLLDYLLIFLPLLVGLLMIACSLDVLLVFLILPIIAAIRPPQKSIGDYMPTFPVSFIPLMAFEWRSGFRRYGWGLMLLYILALVGSYQMGVGIGFTILLALLSIGFFDELEEKTLLEVFKPFDRFFQRKIYWQALFFHGLMLPHYILSLVFHGQFWYLLLVAILIAESILLFCLFFKYAHWHPNRRKAYNQVTMGLYIGSLIVPFLAPAGLFYCWVYYKKAKKNLAYYYG